MLEPYIRSFLIGTMLGDGHMCGTKGGAWLRLGHSSRQLDYLNHKISLLSDYKSARLETYTKAGHTFHQKRFLSHVDFGVIYELFYFEGKRRLSLDLIENLDEIGWSYWYGDDGHTQRDERAGFNANDQASLAVGRDKFADPVPLEKILRAKFGSVKVSYSNKSAFEYNFSTQASQRLAELINPLLEKVLPHKVVRPIRSNRVFKEKFRR